MTLSDEIAACEKCIDLGLADPNRLKTHQKPYVRFEVEEKWKPGKVDVLFIAESPPCNGKQRYFYNPDVYKRKTDLRREVLSRLEPKELEDFRKDGYFLIDTIKCRLRKPIKKKTLCKLAETCSRKFLFREIKQLEPNTIFVLGDTARYTLAQTTEFEELKKYKITDEFDAHLSGYRVILCPFPGGQTRKWTSEINRAFMNLDDASSRLNAESDLFKRETEALQTEIKK